MFNRANLPNPFSSSGPSTRPSQDRYQSYGGEAFPYQYGASRAGGFVNPSYPPQPLSSRPVGGGTDGSLMLHPTKSPNSRYIFGNLVAVSPQDFPPPLDEPDIFIIVNDRYVFSARPSPEIVPGQIGMSDPQRTWAQTSVTLPVNVKRYDPFSRGEQAYLAAVDFEVQFAGKKETPVKYDQNDLTKLVVRNFQNQIIAPQQLILMDDRNIPLLLTVKDIQLGSLDGKHSGGPSSSRPTDRGILTPQTLMSFSKNPLSRINLGPSNRRPAANAIIQPNFKFEDMGIGGLDAEFSTIFRRAFASRVFPPNLVDKLGLQHVKGILLYGPPGTGKTLIARRIGQMLNARPPKVINGPEVLNKFVGQSEENIRKLFGDAEKEYKEKGEDSGLHIIIFDELDAVCKQRGSGAGGGTGVGDSVVNQLLSKLDGVDQLNNILLIGMTNRMDMIDDALLRPGRLELHMEISLPDEFGRVQILKIHTQKMRESSHLGKDVDIMELARLTKNYSGAEINGLVRAATSFAFSRHIEVGTGAGVREDAENIKVNRDDFIQALDEVKPAFGVSEAELSSCIQKDIIHFSPSIARILNRGDLFVKQLQERETIWTTPLLSVLIHGSPEAGKTALAAKIAIDSQFSFIKLIRPADMAGFNEMAKISHINKIFADAYKSATSVVVIDEIETIIDWVPIGPRFSNAVLQALRVLLKNDPPKDRRLLIIATTSERSVMEQLQMTERFNSLVGVPTVDKYEQLQYILETTKAFNPEDSRRACARIEELTQATELGIGIKNVLFSIGTAHQDKKDPVSRFADEIDLSLQRKAM